jgi:hypothetical protein
VDELLGKILVLLVGPQDAGFYDELAAKLRTFDERGTPWPELRTQSHRRWRRTLDQTAGLMDTVAKVTGAIWAAANFALVVWLTATGRLQLSGIPLAK